MDDKVARNTGKNYAWFFGNLKGAKDRRKDICYDEHGKNPQGDKTKESKQEKHQRAEDKTGTKKVKEL